MACLRRCTLTALALLAAGFCVAVSHSATLPPVVRGAKIVLLQVEPGPLKLTLYKRDLNIYDGADNLVALLYDPARRPVATLEIPDDGQPLSGGGPGELQSAEATVECKGAGVYRLMVAGVSHGDAVFGLETSAPRCVVAGSDITLNDGSIGGRLYFEPPAKAFKITAQALHDPGRQTMPLMDSGGKVVANFDLSQTGEDQVVEVEPETGARDGLWHFDIEKMDVKMSIGGVSYWTLDAAAWFPADKTRWMLLPYRQTRYLQPGGQAELDYQLRNSSGEDGALSVAVEGDPGLECRVLEPQGAVALKPQETCLVRVAVRLADDVTAGAALAAHVTAAAVDDPAVTESSGLEVRVGESPVSQYLDLPIVLRRYEHENVQFGYAPQYVCNEVYFDLDNRPLIRQRTGSMYGSSGITLLEEGKWVERGFLDAIRAAHPEYRTSYGGGGFLGAKIAFDGDGGAYTLLRLVLEGKGRQCVLLYTPDEGKTYSVYDLPGNSFDIEQFTGHNALHEPPPILSYVWTANHPARFASYHDLLLFMPSKENGHLVLGEPIKVAENCLGSCQHSGGPASTATRDGKTHIVWGEIAEDDAPGVPTYVATYDHATGKVGRKVLLGYGPPVNDVHNVPAICLDSEGTLHVLIGAHGQAFQYTHSLAPNDAYSGWTKPVPALAAGSITDDTDEDGDGRQTYISLVCDQNDALHSAFRQWRRNADEYWPDQTYAALSVQSKPKGKPWGPARPIVIPPVPGYSIYYHKLTVDRHGWLYLSYSYWTSDTTYQDEFPGRYEHRAVVVSKDGGARWKLAETADFEAGIGN